MVRVCRRRRQIHLATSKESLLTSVASTSLRQTALQCNCIILEHQYNKRLPPPALCLRGGSQPASMAQSLCVPHSTFHFESYLRSSERQLCVQVRKPSKSRAYSDALRPCQCLSWIKAVYLAPRFAGRLLRAEEAPAPKVMGIPPHCVPRNLKNGWQVAP